MATFKYPQSDLDSPKKLLSLLGGFWSSTYQGNNFVEETVAAKGAEAQQSYLDFLDLIRAISRYELPVFSKKNWYALKIKESEFVSSRQVSYQYQTKEDTNCGSKVYAKNKKGNPIEFSGENFYGEKELRSFYTVALPKKVVAIPQIQNKVINPDALLSEGIDYKQDGERLLFFSNIFEESKWDKREILNAAGEIVDRECVLWCYKGIWDLDTVYEQFGYALSLRLKSSEGYKEFVNAIFDSFVYGASIESQFKAIVSVFGLPSVQNEEEVVEKIIHGGGLQQVVTDANVYQLPETSSLLVSVGDKLKKGDVLTDSLQIYELNRGLRADHSLESVTVDTGLLAFGFFKGITFENKDTALKVETDTAGRTKVSWELGGFTYDVDKFWEDVHKQGIKEGKTLAQILDTRNAPDTEPTASDLPATINPLKFLVDNFLRNNAYIVKLKIRDCDKRLKFFPVSQFRKAQPPNTLLIMILDLEYCDNPISLENEGSELAPGCFEGLNGFPCMVAEEPGNLLNYIGESVRTRIIGGRCI